MKELKCMHYKGDGFTYEISDKECISLCDCCNMNLAGEIAKQQAIHTFVPQILDKRNNEG